MKARNLLPRHTRAARPLPRLQVALLEKQFALEPPRTAARRLEPIRTLPKHVPGSIAIRMAWGPK